MKAKSKSQPRTLLSRPPLERMLKIHQAISSGHYPNATKLARDMEVSTKSIHRDIEFMRDRFQMPIEYNPQRNGYWYTEAVEGFPTLQITEGELFALLVAEKALQQYRGTSFEKPLLSAFRKMSSSLPDTISLNISEWEQTISFRTSAEQVLDLEVFDKLSKATAQRKQLKLRYRKPGQREIEDRLVDPYHLANINGEWFLFAHCHLRNDLRTFVPSRIHGIEETGKRFVRPRQFSLEKRLRNSFAVRSGQTEYSVAIRFDEWASDYIREKKWHGSQVLTELPDGGVELRMRVSSLGEIQRWILGWGGAARVVEPPELVESLRNAAADILKQYPS
jgi:predicted DNA-binding transcriptional regulator YafY